MTTSKKQDLNTNKHIYYKMGKKILLLLALVIPIFLIANVSALVYCYAFQNQVNGGTSGDSECGGFTKNYGGSYSYSGKYVYMTYYKPSPASSVGPYTLWNVRYGSITNEQIIPKSCINAYSDRVLLRFFSEWDTNPFPATCTSYGECYTGSSWIAATTTETGCGGSRAL